MASPRPTAAGAGSTTVGDDGNEEDVCLVTDVGVDGIDGFTCRLGSRGFRGVEYFRYGSV